MTPQSATTSEFSRPLSNDLRIVDETCPSCGQEIPIEKLEEVRGRIALREREQALAVTARLEEKFRIERLQAQEQLEAARKTATEREERFKFQIQQLNEQNTAALETERTEAKAREEQIRVETNKAAEASLAQRIAVVERSHSETQAALQARIAETESNKTAAEEQVATLAQTIENLRAEAYKREQEIRTEATNAADAAAGQRLAAIEESHLNAQAALQAQITEIESNRVAAEQRAATLSQTVEEIRAESKKQEEQIRADATKAAEAAVAQRLAALEQSHKDATATLEARIVEIESNKTAAEQQVTALSQTIEVLRNTKDAELAKIAEQHVKTMGEQREALEKANEAALNLERAKSFEETQKLSNKVNELQRALEKKTNEELGEGAEIDLFEALKKDFPEDRISRIAKGEAGADIRHIVIANGKECGTILYDSKNHKAFRTEHVAKLRTDQLAAKAEHAILSTHKFPQGTRQLQLQDGVLLANPARVVVLATMLRQHLIHVHTLRLSSIERERKTFALYDFITSDRCTNLLGRVDERCEELLSSQTAEMKWHQKHWQKQGEALRAIQKAKADLEHEISTIIGAEELE